LISGPDNNIDVASAFFGWKVLMELSVFGGTGFVGKSFCQASTCETTLIPREDRTPVSDDVLYLISTTHNYHVLDDVHKDVDTNLTILLDVLKNLVPELKTPLVEYPAQLLGSLELSLPRITEIYSNFIDKQCSKMSEESLFDALTEHSETTIRRQVSKELVQLKFFGKTGTTNKGLDNWFVFNDGVVQGVIWVGYEGNRNIEDFKFFGSNTAFQIFQEFIINRGKRIGGEVCLDQNLTL